MKKLLFVFLLLACDPVAAQDNRTWDSLREYGSLRHSHGLSFGEFKDLNTEELTISNPEPNTYPTIWFKSEGQYVAHINAHMHSKAGTPHDHMEFYTRCGDDRNDEDGGFDCPRLGIDAGHDVATVFVTEHALLRVRHERGISMKGEDGHYYRLRIKAGGVLDISRDTYFPQAGQSAQLEEAQ